MQAVQNIIDAQLKQGKASSNMLDWFADTCILILVLVIALPGISVCGIVFTGPLTEVFAAGMFIKGINLIDAAIEEIEADVETFDENLGWINQCVDSNFFIDFDKYEEAKAAKLEVASEIGSLRALMITQITFVAIFFFVLFTLGVAALVNGDPWGNFSRNRREFKCKYNDFFFKHFKFFN